MQPPVPANPTQPLRRDASASLLSDVDLLRRVSRGDEEAFGQIWTRFGGAVYSACALILGPGGSAEDAAQEAFTRIWRKARQFDPERGTPAAWILTIARNAARNVARVRVPIPTDDPPTHGVDSHAGVVADRFAIEHALTTLSDAERQVIEMAFFEDLTHAQIAAQLDTPLGTVKARIRRALAQMADIGGLQ